MSDTFERFQALAVQVLAVDADKVTKEASFADDLDADSLDLVELVMALEDEFDITVEEEELEDIKTVGQAFDMVTPSSSLSDGHGGRRVAVTGVGVLSARAATGSTPSGRAARATPDGERRVEDFDPASVFDNPKEARRADRVTQLALGRRHRGPRPGRRDRGRPAASAVLIATGIGGIAHPRGADPRAPREGRRPVSPFLVPMMMPNAAAAPRCRCAGAGRARARPSAPPAPPAPRARRRRHAGRQGRCDVVAAGGSRGGHDAREPRRVHQHDAHVVAGEPEPFDATATAS